MRVLFILDYSFPSPSASSNRIEALCKGFLQKGHIAEIICLRGTWTQKKSKSYSNIKSYFLSSKYRPQAFIKRNALKLCGIFRSFIFIFKENMKLKINVVFILVIKNVLNFFFFFFLILFNRIFLKLFYNVLFKILNIKIVQERSEYPEIYKRNILEKTGYYFYKYFFTRLLDGMLVMTNSLKLYYSDLLRKKSVIKVIPMSVDMDRFVLKKKMYKENLISYCGDLSSYKDGVDVLIKAFGLISFKYPEWKLNLIGGSSDNQLKVLNELCEELKLTDKVIFSGKKTRDSIPEMLAKSKILALARPSSLQAQGVFPTKLGEYLATKKPVVITEVGNIENYLKDKESAYISRPDSVEDFALKLEECICNNEKAQEIGQKGYEVASRNFDYKGQAELLNDFLLKLGSKNEY